MGHTPCQPSTVNNGGSIARSIARSRSVGLAPPPEDPALAEEARLAADEDMPEAIGFIRSSTSKMDRLINAILKLSREGRRALQPERVDLGELLAGIRRQRPASARRDRGDDEDRAGAAGRSSATGWRSSRSSAT